LTFAHSGPYANLKGFHNKSAMSLYCAQGSPDREFSSGELKELFLTALEKTGAKRNKVLAIPP